MCTPTAAVMLRFEGADRTGAPPRRRSAATTRSPTMPRAVTQHPRPSRLRPWGDAASATPSR